MKLLNIAASAAFVIVSAHCGQSMAQEQQYGNWVVDSSVAGYQIARTQNDSGAVTGIICSIRADGCETYFATDVICENGARYPLMINSAVGSFHIIATCKIYGDKRVLIISEFDRAISAFESGGEIGFAMPMQNGEFRVSRFSTTGATLALKTARSRPTKTPTAKPARRDTTM